MKALIAEDDFISRKLLHKMLSDRGECDVTVNGMEAIEVFKEALNAKSPYDLVCLDILMPKLSGFEVLKLIRQEEVSREILGLSGVKIIMTTGLDSTPDVIDAFKGGCEAYIVKPIDPKLLWSTIAKLGIT